MTTADLDMKLVITLLVLLNTQFSLCQDGTDTYAYPLDACRRTVGNTQVVLGPQGMHALDLSSPDASVVDTLNWELRNSYFSLQMYVKFPEPTTEIKTFFELGVLLKLQRRPDDLIQVVLHIRNKTSNDFVTKTTVLGDVADESDDDWVQLIGMRVKIEQAQKTPIKKRAASEDGWILFGMAYDPGQENISFYLNGAEVKHDMGDLKGLDFTFGSMSAKGVTMSCIGVSFTKQDPEFFTRNQLCEDMYKDEEYLKTVQTCDEEGALDEGEA